MELQMAKSHYLLANIKDWKFRQYFYQNKTISLAFHIGYFFDQLHSYHKMYYNLNSMNDQQVKIKNLLKIENNMEIDCVFAMYNLKIIKMLRLIHGEIFLKTTTK